MKIDLFKISVMQVPIEKYLVHLHLDLYGIHPHIFDML